MLGIHTIGAGGGSIGWIDQGGLLRMGPHSAGAKPGPACYGLGGKLPTTTDANLVLGLSRSRVLFRRPDASWMSPLRATPSSRHIAGPIGLSVEQAAAGMYRVACNNMAQGVRAVTIKRGFDPREFPLVVGGGAGPMHRCVIASELEIAAADRAARKPRCCARRHAARAICATISCAPSSIGCPMLDWRGLQALVDDMAGEGSRILESENIGTEGQDHAVMLDCRYLQQYHEVSFPVPRAAIAEKDAAAILRAFHAEHHAPVRLFARGGGHAGRDRQRQGAVARRDRQAAGVAARLLPARTPLRPARANVRHTWWKSEAFRPMPVYDGHRLRYGNRIAGPALVEHGDDHGVRQRRL